MLVFSAVQMSVSSSTTAVPQILRWGNVVNFRNKITVKMRYRRCPLITRCGGSFSQEKPGVI